MKNENSIQVRFAVKSFRKIPNPMFNSNNASETKPEMYQLIADVQDLPDNFPMDTNPRKQNLDTKAAKKIKDSLLNPVDHNFYLLNRGILLSAANISFDNINNMVTIDFDDPMTHGNVDGGHTYKVILENRAQIKRGEQFVRIEVLTGIEDFFESVAAARNTSYQVKDKSIANLAGQFQMIKDAIAKEKYANDINYMENDEHSIDIQDLLAIYFMFNLQRFPNGGNSYPTSAYSAKKVCLDEYLNDFNKFKSAGQVGNPYYKMTKIMPDIIRLYDMIEVNMPVYYKGDNPGMKQYGRIIGVAMPKSGTKFESKYLKTKMDYASPNGFLYPIIGAFRALVKEGEDGFYTWKKDPFQVLADIGADLVNSAVEMSRQLGNNPNATGKSVNLWKELYKSVLIATMSFND